MSRHEPDTPTTELWSSLIVMNGPVIVWHEIQSDDGEGRCETENRALADHQYDEVFEAIEAKTKRVSCRL